MAAAIRHADADRANSPTRVPAEVNDGVTTRRLRRMTLSMFLLLFGLLRGSP